MSEELKEAKATVKKLMSELAVERKACVDALRERDYYGAKWRLFEIECNRLGSPITHNPLTKEQVSFLQLQVDAERWQWTKNNATVGYSDRNVPHYEAMLIFDRPWQEVVFLEEFVDAAIAARKP